MKKLLLMLAVMCITFASCKKEEFKCEVIKNEYVGYCQAVYGDWLRDSTVFVKQISKKQKTFETEEDAKVYCKSQYKDKKHITPGGYWRYVWITFDSCHYIKN